MIRRSERKRRRPAFFSPSQSLPSSSKITKNARQECSAFPTELAQQCSFNDLPPEVLETIFRFLPYRTIAGPVRLISKKCAAVSTTILNSAFLSAGARIRSTMNQLEAQSSGSSRKGNDELSRGIRGRAHDCLELVQAQWELLRACCWRYTHPAGERSFGRLCFYGGCILDGLDEIVDDARRRPETLIGNDDATSRRILEFGIMCKTFMNFFEKLSERKVNKSSLISGCKAVDLLDCLLIGKELLSCRVSGQRSSTTAVSMKIRYKLQRTWFTCLEVPKLEASSRSGEDSWRDQQRFMYLRLRRLVGIVNEHYLEKKHYDREVKFSGEYLPPPRHLPCSTYSGYGECGGRFYYYGNLNEYAYDNKIIDTWNVQSTRDRLQKKSAQEKPCYELVIDVELKCSPELAPLAVRSMLKCDDFENSIATSHQRPHMYLKLSITCPASASNRLPGYFVWELRNRRRAKFN